MWLPYPLASDWHAIRSWQLRHARQARLPVPDGLAASVAARTMRLHLAIMRTVGHVAVEEGGRTYHRHYFDDLRSLWPSLVPLVRVLKATRGLPRYNPSGYDWFDSTIAHALAVHAPDGWPGVAPMLRRRGRRLAA